MLNFSRATFVLVTAAVVLLAALHFKSRAKENEHFTETQKALSELRLQIESQQHLFTALQSKIEDSDRHFLTSTTSAVPGLSSTELLDRTFGMLQEQSNTLARIQEQLWVTRAETPQQTRHFWKTGVARLRQRYEEENQKLEAALEKLDALRLSLSVPHEVAALNEGLDSRFVSYREFFEAKRDCEELRRFTQALRLKLAVEEVDLGVPSSRQCP